MPRRLLPLAPKGQLLFLDYAAAHPAGDMAAIIAAVQACGGDAQPAPISETRTAVRCERSRRIRQKRNATLAEWQEGQTRCVGPGYSRAWRVRRLAAGRFKSDRSRRRQRKNRSSFVFARIFPAV